MKGRPGSTRLRVLVLLCAWPLLAACGTFQVGVERTMTPPAGDTPTAAVTTTTPATSTPTVPAPATPTPAAATPTPTAAQGSPDACAAYLRLLVSAGGVEEPATVTSYHCHDTWIDSTGGSPGVPALTVLQGVSLSLEPGAAQPPATVELRLYAGAGVSASFMRWPEELPGHAEPVDRFRPDLDGPIEYPVQAPPGTYSLVVRVTWEEDIDLFYAISFVLAAAPTPEARPEPRIAFFTVSPTQVEPGDTVTLTWEASGDRATICPTARFVLFTHENCLPVPLSGETTFTLPLDVGGNRFIDFLLTTETEGIADPAVWQISVALKCDTTWFFSDEPQAGICPRDPVATYAAAQRFERGTMIWLEQPGRYVILAGASLDEPDAAGQVYYANDPLDIVRDTSAQVSPPEGLYAPVSGFGLVWRGDVSSSPGYRETLGWALAPEFGYDATWQCDDALPSGGQSWQTCNLLGPDGEVIVLNPLDTWRVLDKERTE